MKTVAVKALGNLLDFHKAIKELALQINNRTKIRLEDKMRTIKEMTMNLKMVKMWKMLVKKTIMMMRRTKELISFMMMSLKMMIIKLKSTLEEVLTIKIVWVMQILAKD